mmetsp:Transcript_23037/g.74611  ORF Transcript_23037/g.74611 Transcript_23037/m.74611 type:complete len:324 (-) Transcript_23037:298-1269(-)
MASTKGATVRARSRRFFFASACCRFRMERFICGLYRASSSTTGFLRRCTTRSFLPRLGARCPCARSARVWTEPKIEPPPPPPAPVAVGRPDDGRLALRPGPPAAPACSACIGCGAPCDTPDPATPPTVSSSAPPPMASSSSSESGSPSLRTFGGAACQSNSSPKCETMVTSAFCLGGSEWYAIVPAFHSWSTARAAASWSGAPPLPSFPRLSATSVKNSVADSNLAMPKCSRSCSAVARSSSASMGACRSAIFSTLTQFRRSTDAASAGVLGRAKTMPGQSTSLTRLSMETTCATVVTPGVAPTVTARDRFSALISDDLPTLG